MKVPIIRLIDLGYDEGFGKSMGFAQSLIESINVSGTRADVEYLRTVDMSLVTHALTVPARLIHIMAHGIKDPSTLAFGGANSQGYADPDRMLYLDDLAEYLQDAGEGIEATAVFADCCDSAQQRFVRALRNSLEDDIVYIGAPRRVDWHECTTFDSILYGSLLRKRGVGWDARDWVRNAACFSIKAYEDAVQGKCPFKVQELSPSRSALKAFADAMPGRGLLKAY